MSKRVGSAFELPGIATPSANSASGWYLLYFKSDGRLYSKTSAGVEALVVSGDGSALTNLNASALGTGTVPTARLGTGTANSTTFLRGDGTWAVGGGSGATKPSQLSPDATSAQDSSSATSSKWVKLATYVLGVPYEDVHINYTLTAYNMNQTVFANFAVTIRSAAVGTSPQPPADMRVEVFDCDSNLNGASALRLIETVRATGSNTYELWLNSANINYVVWELYETGKANSLGGNAAAPVVTYYTNQAWALSTTSALTTANYTPAGHATLMGYGTLPDARLPARLGTVGSLLTSSDNMDTVTNSGWYWHTSASVPTNAPTAAAYTYEVISRASNYTIQVAYQNTTGTTAKMYMRTSAAGTWSTWQQVLLRGDDGSGLTNLNASALATGTVPNNTLPARIQNQVEGSAAQVTDWNTATESGWYTANAATNAPVGGIWFLGEVIAHNTSPGWTVQTLYPFTTTSFQNGSDSQVYRRVRSGGTWGSWYQLMESQAEMDTRYRNASNLNSGTVAPARLGTLTSTLAAVTAASATTTYADTGLSVNLVAGVTYQIVSGGLWSASTTVPTIGIKALVGAAGLGYGFQQWISSGTSTTPATTLSNGWAGGVAPLISGVATTTAVNGGVSPWAIQGWFSCTTSGTFKIQYARNSGASGNVYVGPGSYLFAIPVA